LVAASSATRCATLQVTTSIFTQDRTL
jgi:hypothetical protein